MNGETEILLTYDCGLSDGLPSPGATFFQKPFTPEAVACEGRESWIPQQGSERLGGPEGA